uniref:Uncharacterized protein n=1 Tax=Magallana gigas TaxID=29159 RepID=A0A8W8JQR9_MAGGI
MILSRLLAPGAAQLARCSHRKIHTSASRFGGHPRGIPASERTYKVFRGRSPPNDIVLFFVPKWYDFTDEELGIPPDELGLLKPEAA